jgi:hypothetical protein
VFDIAKISLSHQTRTHPDVLSTESSWMEKRDLSSVDALAKLGQSHPLRKLIEEEVALIDELETGFQPPTTSDNDSDAADGSDSSHPPADSAQNWVAVPKEEWGTTQVITDIEDENSRVLMVDFTPTGAIKGISDFIGPSLKPFPLTNNLGEFAYQTYPRTKLKIKENKLNSTYNKTN